MFSIRSCYRAVGAALLFIIVGCGGGSSSGVSTPSGPTATTPVAAPAPVPTTTVAYSGIFASGTFTGTVTLSAAVPVSAVPAQAANFRPQAVATATGTARFTGATQPTTNLTGSYDTTTGRFMLSGGSFTVAATVSGETVTGTIATPTGTGGIAAMRTTDGNQTTQFCGAYRGTESGKFLIVVRGNLASGVAAQDGEPGAIALDGSASGNSVTFGWSWTEGVGGRGTATGTINGTTASGTWSNTDRQSGTWSGSSTGC